MRKTSDAVMKAGFSRLAGALLAAVLYMTAFTDSCLAVTLSGYRGTDDTVVAGADRDSVPVKVYHGAGLDLRSGYVFPTNRFFKGDNAAGNPVRLTYSAHLKYFFRFGPDTRLGKIYPFARQGVGIAYNRFSGTGELGSPVALYVFQNSRIASLSQSLSLDYEWNFGASFGWKPYDEQTNPFNRVVGSKVNAFISLGLFLDWRISGGWNIVAGANLTHYSNGNTSYPNSGVNVIEGRLGLTYGFGGSTPARQEDKAPEFRKHVSYDVVLYGALRNKGFYLPDGNPCVVPGSFAVAGLNINPMYNFNRFFKAGLSLDAQYDESANIKDHIANDYPSAYNIRFHRPPFAEQFAVGVSVRAEIVMPVFSINIGIGRNIICRGDDTDSFYQMLILKARFTRNAYLHVGYQLYRFKDPNNLMIGIGYTFNNRR